MAGLLERIKAVAEIIIDPYFVVDAQRTIIDFNRAFYQMLPRSLGRGLRGKKCSEVLSLDACKERCIAERCWESGKHIRLDEIRGQIVRTDRQLTFILSALPFFDEQGRPEGAMIVQRNVTDEAQVQIKYQDMLDNARREREQLKYQVRARTKELLEANQRLLRVQRELMGFKRGRMV